MRPRKPAHRTGYDRELTAPGKQLLPENTAMDVKGKKAIVFGGTSGIGLATTRKENGVRVNTRQALAASFQ